MSEELPTDGALRVPATPVVNPRDEDDVVERGQADETAKANEKARADKAKDKGKDDD